MSDFCEPTPQQLQEDLERVGKVKGKAVLSSGNMVEPTIEAWQTELAYRANYTGESELKHAIDEILRLQRVAIQQRDIITALQAERDAGGPISL